MDTIKYESSYLTMSNTDNAERAKAVSNTAFGNLNKKVDKNTKRMAGVALGAMLVPSTIGLFDDNETSFGESAISGGIGLAGVGLGGYMGYKNSTIKPDEMDAFVRDELNKYKTEASIISRKDPSAGVEHFALRKGQLMEDISAIDPQRAKVFNQTLRKVPDLGEMVADLDLLNKTPRQVRGITRGAMLGALASAIPAYLAM